VSESRPIRACPDLTGTPRFRPIRYAARSAAGAPNLRFHDLRHLGGTLAAATGASLTELMARLGHSSTRAALIYQHATRDRDQAIAQALGSLAREVRSPRPRRGRAW
jgi:integrase